MGGGLSSRRYKKLVAAQRAKREPCCICGEPIDYGLPDNHRLAYTTAHDIAVAVAPWRAEDPTNIKGAAHRACNSYEGTGNHERPPTPPLGDTSYEW